MSIFSKQKSLPYEGWLLFGIKKMNETKFATIQQYDEKNELDFKIKNHIDSTISTTKTIFFLINAAMLGPDGKCNIAPNKIGTMTYNTLHFYFTEQGISENDALKKTKEVLDEVKEYMEYLQNNMKNLSNFSYYCCKKYADGIYPPTVNVHDMSSTINEGYKNAIILKYAKIVFETIRNSVNNSLFMTSGIKIKLVSNI